MCREAGGRVSSNVLVRDMDLAVVNQFDSRRLEVLADGLTLWNGSQLAIVSPLHRDGTARRRAADHNGVALEHARRKKAATFPELTRDVGRARLVVLAAEVGGRFSTETAVFLNALAKAKSQSAPQLLRGRVRVSNTRRWEAILACSAPQSFAMSLLERRPTCGTGMDPPSVH